MLNAAPEYANVPTGVGLSQGSLDARYGSGSERQAMLTGLLARHGTRRYRDRNRGSRVDFGLLILRIDPLDAIANTKRRNKIPIAGCSNLFT